jgi:hypothetical protein
MDLFVLFFRLAGDACVLILLYDFFVQPFRFYGMDPLTRFIWVAARWLCAPFDTFSRKVIQLPDRDLTPLFTLVIVLFCRGLIYAAAAAVNLPNPAVILLGVTLSFQDLFTRLVMPGLLLLLYADIQLARHQGSLIGFVPAMLIHDVAKRLILMIRKLLPSYQPLYVFAAVFAYSAVFLWLLLTFTLWPFGQPALIGVFPQVLYPLGVGLLDTPALLLAVVVLYLTNAFLWGIMIVIFLHFIASLSGLNPYDRTSLVLGLVIAPWVNAARRFFPFARAGMIDFSVGILLLILWFVLGLLEQIVARLV